MAIFWYCCVHCTVGNILQCL